MVAGEDYDLPITTRPALFVILLAVQLAFAGYYEANRTPYGLMANWQALAPYVVVSTVVTLLVVEGVAMLVEAFRKEMYTQGLRKGRHEGIEEGLQEGRQEGRQEGTQATDAEWREWYQRMTAANKEGRPFDEPPPDETRQL